MLTRDSDRAPLFYGWYIVGALFFATFIAFGTRQAFGIFVAAWETDFASNVTLIATAASVGWLLNGLSQPIFGRMTDRIGGRFVVLISMSVMAVGSIAMAVVENAWMLLVIYGFVISLASGGISPSITGTIIARWFRRKRGTATSLLVVGGSMGGLLLIPFMTYLFEWTDWRTTWVVVGLVMLLIGVPMVALVVRSDPSDLHLEADGEINDGTAGFAERRRAPEGPLCVDRWLDSFKSAPMWQLSLAYWVCGITTASVAVHFVRWADSEGISPTTAAWAFGALSAINAAGVLTVGWISDKIQRKYLLGAVYLVRALAFLALIVLPGHAALWGFAVIGGMSWLATVPLTSALTAEVYGVRHMGILFGMVNMTHQVGGALAVFLFGVVFDRWGSYDAAFATGAVLLGVAGLLALTINERGYSARYSPVQAPAGGAGTGEAG